MDYRALSYVAPEVLPDGDVLQPMSGIVFAMSTEHAMSMPDAMLHLASMFAMMANQDAPVVNLMHRTGAGTFSTLASTWVNDTYGVAKSVAWFGRDVDTIGVVFERGPMLTIPVA